MRGPETVRATFRTPLAWSLPAHLASRWLFWELGVRFDAAWLPASWQIVATELLRDDLARSLLYLHGQPPLFNALLGLAFQLPPGIATGLLQAFFLGCGLLLHASLYGLLRRTGAGPRAAAALALLFAVSPAVVCYESWLFYTYPAAAALAAAAVAAHRYAQGRRAADGVACFAAVAAVAASVSLFHLLWCLAVLGAVLAAMPRRDRRRTLAVAGGPLLLVLALYAKNAVLFGEFTASTWMGMNLARVALYRAPGRPCFEAARRAGEVSDLAAVAPFSPLGRYRGRGLREPAWPVPVLAEPTKRGARIPNYNHAAYIDVSRAYLGDSLATIRACPGLYLANVGRAVAHYALPATDHWFLRRNRAVLAGWDRAFALVPEGAVGTLLDGRRETPLPRHSPAWLARHAAYGWMALLAAALLLAARRGLRALRGAARRPQAALYLFVALTIGWVTLAGNLFELRENHRFRFMVDPLVWGTVGGAGAAALGRRLGGRRSGAD